MIHSAPSPTKTVAAGRLAFPEAASPPVMF
jgi:hypothetical protein